MDCDEILCFFHFWWLKPYLIASWLVVFSIWAPIDLSKEPKPPLPPGRPPSRVTETDVWRVESSFEFDDKTLPLLSNLNLQKLGLTRPSKPLIDTIASYNGYEWLLTENGFMILTHWLTLIPLIQRCYRI